MPIATLTSKGQVTIPKEIRKFLNLEPSAKVIISVENSRAVIKPLYGNILDIGGSVKIPNKRKPTSFHEVRNKTKNVVSKKIVLEG